MASLLGGKSEVQGQLGDHVLKVRSHRPSLDTHRCSDVVVPLAIREAPNHLALSLGEHDSGRSHRASVPRILKGPIPLRTGEDRRRGETVRVTTRSSSKWFGLSAFVVVASLTVAGGIIAADHNVFLGLSIVAIGLALSGAWRMTHRERSRHRREDGGLPIEDWVGSPRRRQP